MESKSIDFVNVGVRIRPGLNRDSSSSSVKIINESPPILCVCEKNLTYCFDHIFPEDTTQKYVYETMVEPLVRQVKCGYNCTVFAYGQTGTGKTYTMGSDPNPQNSDNAGFISRTLDDFFLEDVDAVTLSVSFFEIYNEKVYDLLNDSTVALPVKGFKIDGLQEVAIGTKMEAYELLKIGSKKRHIGEMKQNSKSSRSHAIFTVHCINRQSRDVETKAKLNLVDLAGSESVRKTESRGSQFHEGVNINKGLFYVGQVINALSTNAHVPYRQSVITSILQDSLSKNNYVTLVACISPDKADVGETICVLDFAQKVKKIKNKPEVNSIIKEYKKNSGLINNPGSAVKSRNTPIKRAYPSISHQTPLYKMPRVETITERTNSSALDSPKSLFSMSLSSISDMPQNFSPVIKKYFNAFEATIMEKLQKIVSDTVKTNTAELLDWDKLQNTVARVVKNEINQAKSNFACSSPNSIDLSEVEKNYSPEINKENLSPNSNHFIPKKLFGGDETVPKKNDDEQFEMPTLTVKNGDDEIFKMPTVPVRQPKKKSTPKKNLRRSLRLSLKAADVDDNRRSNAPQNTPRPTPAPRQRTKTPRPTPRTKSIIDRTSKMTHDEQVLNILNEGDEKQLQTLAMVGIKTAKQIILYREINGHFNSLDDLEKMPWHGSMLSRFMKANFLR